MVERAVTSAPTWEGPAPSGPSVVHGRHGGRPSLGRKSSLVTSAATGEHRKQTCGGLENAAADLEIIGDRTFVSDAEMTGLGELFDQAGDFGFGGGFAQVTEQMVGECRFALGTVGDVFA